MDKVKPGQSVQFIGLNGAKHLNGTRGRLDHFLKKEGRWAVKCNLTGEVVKAKPTNLQVIVDQAVSSKGGSGGGDHLAMHKQVFESYFHRSMGGAIVSSGNRYMLAVEFNAPTSGGRAISADIVYVDKDPKAQAVVRGRGCRRAMELGEAFLRGETIEYIEAGSEDEFFALLSKYKRGSSTEYLIDMGSGLMMHSVTI